MFYISVTIGSLTASAASIASANAYLSQVDKSLTIHRMGVLPVNDNADGLYSRYVEAELKEDVRSAHRVDFGDVKDADPRQLLTDYEDNSESIKKIAQASDLDALIGARVKKTASEVSLTVDLFLASSGELFAQEVYSTPEKMGTTDIEHKTKELILKLIKKIPYQGLVLSREGNNVTIDIGSKDGIHEGEVLTVSQIISMKTHPKFHFLISTEKEVLGKVRVTKTDETLSFGVILQESERGVISRDAKITGLDKVVYADPLGDMKSPSDLDDPISFGANPKEWKPLKKPGLGKLGLQLGVGSLHDAIATQLAGSFSTDVSLYPQLDLSGELWLTQNWFVNALIEQGIMSISNPSGGSGSLSAHNGYYRLHAGYKFLLTDDFFGPQLDVHLGYGSYSWFVDANNPTTFTSMTYSGVYTGFGGSMPVTADRLYYVNANLHYYFSPGLSETPVTSGSSSSNGGTEFSVGGTRRLKDQLWLKADLDFLFFSTTFSGVGTRLYNGSSDSGLNASHNTITLLGGVEYLF